MAADMLSDLQRHADRENTPTCCTIEVTKHCNFQCRHCYLPRPSPRETIRIPLEVYRRFLHELKQMGGLSVCFTGGEPLLFADDLLDVLGMVRRKGMVPTLYTNASLMTREIASSLREGRVLEVAVTLYGSCARTMDDFTGQEGSFDKAIQGIRFLVEEDNHVRVRWPVTRDNLEEFTDFYRLVRGLGAQPTHYTCFDPCLDGSREPYKLQMEERDFLRYVDILSTLDIFGTYLSRSAEMF